MGAPLSPERFLGETLVECPRCFRQAVVRNAAGATPRVTCGSCGYHADGAAGAPRLSWSTVRADGREPSFALPLWLRIDCCGGHLLWALNEPHLDYLERFVVSTDRDRDFPSPPGDRGLAYKLPTWIQLSGNREELLRALGRLRQRLT